MERGLRLACRRRGDAYISCKEELAERSSIQQKSGVPGDTTTEYYSTHAPDSMVEVPSRRCAGENYLKRAVCGSEGGQKVISCPEHVMEGMIDFAKQTFVHEAVPKRPSSGIPDLRRVRAGGVPAKEAPLARNITGRTIGRERLSLNIPLVGWWPRLTLRAPATAAQCKITIMPGSRQREFRALYAAEEKVAVARKKCRREGCSQMPSYGVNSSREPSCSPCVRATIDGTVAVPVASKESCLRASCPEPPRKGVGAK